MAKMADLLAEAGFEVLEAWNGQTAILQIERHDAIRFVAADADPTGPEGRFALAREILLRWPDLTRARALLRSPARPRRTARGSPLRAQAPHARAGAAGAGAAGGVRDGGSAVRHRNPAAICRDDTVSG